MDSGVVLVVDSSDCLDTGQGASAIARKVKI